MVQAPYLEHEGTKMSEGNMNVPFDFLHPKEFGDQSGINKALLDCQTEYPSIPKNGTGKIQGRSKAGKDYDFTYKYALFQDIMDAVRPILNKNGVLFSQKPFPCITDGNLYIVTELTHAKSGGRQAVYYPVCDYTNAKQQEVGGNLTYAKRYSLVILGIILDEDTDAQLTEARTAKRKEVTKQEAIPHDPKTGEVVTEKIETQQDSKTIARQAYDKIISDDFQIDDAELTYSYLDDKLKEGSLSKSHHEAVTKVLHARKMIAGSKTFDMLEMAREAVDAVPEYLKIDGKLAINLEVKEAEISATSISLKDAKGMDSEV